MTTKDYSALLEGVDAHDLPLGVLRDICDLFLEGAQRCARLMAEGRSVARGAVPTWVNLAADIHVTRFAAGSLDLGFRATRLIDVAPEIFAQQQLFPAGTDADATAFDLFLDAADDAASGRRDSERLDAGVLEVLARTGSVIGKAGIRLSVSGPGRRPIALDQATVQVIRTLADEIPPARIARVRGILDALAVSTRTIALRLEDGRILRGFAGAVELEELKRSLGADVVLEGQVTFRPSGVAQRIEVESILPATSGDVIWAQLPKAERMPARLHPAVPVIGLDAFFGKWPGEETDEQLAAALRDSA